MVMYAFKILTIRGICESTEVRSRKCILIKTFFLAAASEKARVVDHRTKKLKNLWFPTRQVTFLRYPYPYVASIREHYTRVLGLH